MIQILKFKEDLMKALSNEYKFCNLDIKTFILIFGKDVYYHENMDDWKKSSETSFT